MDILDTTNLLAEGGEIIELLILLLVMVLSAIGSLVKNRSQASKKKRSGKPGIQKKQPGHPARSPEFQRRSKTSESGQEAKRGSILQRIPLPMEPSPQPEQQPPIIPLKAKKVVPSKPKLEPSEESQKVVTALEKTEMFPGQEQAQQAFLKHEDLKRAIVIREILGPPKALQDI